MGIGGWVLGGWGLGVGGCRGAGVPGYQDGRSYNKIDCFRFILQNIIYCITKQHIIHTPT
jgi:hypothetical protein